jgi:hypothetical protein
VETLVNGLLVKRNYSLRSTRRLAEATNNGTC